MYAEMFVLAVKAAIETPTKETLSKRAYDASPKDAPLRSLFPDEPRPPQPVCGLPDLWKDSCTKNSTDKDHECACC